MKRKAQFLFAGHGGKPVYVQGFLTDEDGASAELKFEVVSAAPELRPAPGIYRATELPGGWLMLAPDQETTKEQDEAIITAAKAAGFGFRI
jgi:hypothetical protein